MKNKLNFLQFSALTVIGLLSLSACVNAQQKMPAVQSVWHKDLEK